MAEPNRLSYGLAAYAFTRSIKTAHQLAQQVETGMLWINQPAVASAEMPFGGVKDSGYGSEGGPEALEAYLVAKAVSIAADRKSTRLNSSHSQISYAVFCLKKKKNCNRPVRSNINS